MFSLNISTQHCARGISHDKKTRKLMKGTKMGKEEANYLYLSSLGRKFLESTKKNRINRLVKLGFRIKKQHRKFNCVSTQWQ